MTLKLKIDVPYVVNETTYYVEQEIVFEQSFVKENDENFWCFVALMKCFLI